jgi:hypothetical protein
MKYLDKYHPEWPQHQEKILDLLKVNPTLVSDPETLYQRASGRKTTRGAAKAKKVKLKRVGATGERGGRKPIGVVPKKVLDPSRALGTVLRGLLRREDKDGNSLNQKYKL